MLKQIKFPYNFWYIVFIDVIYIKVWFNKLFYISHKESLY